MSGGRVAAIAGRILRQFRHDPRTVALIAIVPLVVMALIGYLISDDKEPLPVAVVNADAPVATPAGEISIGGLISRELSHAPTLTVRLVANEGAAERQVREGDVAGAVILPTTLTEALAAHEPAQIRVIVRGVEPGLEGPVLNGLSSAIVALRTTPAGARLAGPGLSVERVALLGASGLETLDYNAPVLIAVFAFLFTFMLTSVAFLRERSTGTLARLMASPVSRLEVLAGYLLGFLGFAMLQALLVLGYVTWILHVHVEGSIWIVLLFLGVLVVGVVNLGIALSFYARNELQVVQFIPLILLPQVFLGGLFWPVQSLWAPLRYLSQVFPLTHAGAALRAVMVGGDSLGGVTARLLALIGFAAAMTLLGVLALRNQRA